MDHTKNGERSNMKFCIKCSNNKKSNLRISLIYLSFCLIEILLVSPCYPEFKLVPWSEGSESHNGLTRMYANKEAMISWNNNLGDWCDKAGYPQGDIPFGQTNVDVSKKSFELMIDVSELVKEYAKNQVQKGDFILRNVGEGGITKCHSRETTSFINRPRLVLNLDDKQLARLPVADTFTDQSTLKGLGLRDHLYFSNKQNTYLRFLLPLLKTDEIKSAFLHLSVIKQYKKPSIVGVFRSCYLTIDEDIERRIGIAKDYLKDKGIKRHPSVILTDTFDRDSRQKGPWSYGYDRETLQIVETDPENVFSPFDGKALKVTIPKGHLTGMQMGYVFRTENEKEPEALFFRYYLRFGENWDPLLAGKLPGVAGTYGKAGWGTRKSNGFNGWSARGLFRKTVRENDSTPGKIPIGSYVYHANQPKWSGENFIWNKHMAGFLNKNKWYCVEQYVKLNTPGEKNGILKAWVDGIIAYENFELEFRKIPDLKIEKVWMNVFHGGKMATDKDISLFIDNVVVATEYIGPCD